MDVRDFEFWAEEASRQRTRRQLETMEQVRIGMWAEPENYSRMTREMRMSLITPVEKKRMWDSAWTALGKIGRA